MQPKQHRPSQLICNINVAGFAGVMFALLYLFMPNAADVDVHRGAPVDLAKVSSPVSMRAADREDAMIVGITRDGKIFFRNDQVMLDQLPSRIREAVGQGSEKKVYVKADAHAKYVWVAGVLDRAHDAGVEKIGFLVDKRPTSLPSPQ